MGEPDERPVLGIGYEARSHGVIDNVIGFFDASLFRAESMFEKIFLPDNPMVSCEPSFPVGDPVLDGLLVWRKGHDGVQVVRHEQ